MLTRGDLIDIIVSRLLESGVGKSPEKPAPARGRSAVPKGRPFFSEHRIREMIAAGKPVRVPTEAIISPLAEDWLILNGIKVVRE
ncbi:MAG: hypothetical protein ACYCPQ_06220 [Elusimicrobiota bacterium]